MLPSLFISEEDTRDKYASGTQKNKKKKKNVLKKRKQNKCMRNGRVLQLCLVFIYPYTWYGKLLDSLFTPR